jgi:hypothetical protein
MSQIRLLTALWLFGAVTYTTCCWGLVAFPVNCDNNGRLVTRWVFIQNTCKESQYSDCLACVSGAGCDPSNPQISGTCSNSHSQMSNRPCGTNACNWVCNDQSYLQQADCTREGNFVLVNNYYDTCQSGP